MHIQDKDWDAYFYGTLPAQGRADLLTHVAECTYCAKRLAADFPKRLMLPTHPHLRVRILQKVRICRRRSLFLKETEYGRYCLKIGFGMCCAVFMTFHADLAQAKLPQIAGVAADFVRERQKAYERGLREQDERRRRFFETKRQFIESIDQFWEREDIYEQEKFGD